MDKKERLEDLEKKITSCARCPLYKKASKAVPGEGNPEAEIMLIGEAPGYHESVQGRPFVGAAGNLLTKLLESNGFKRSDVFICNMLRHRPPNNRDPLPSEIEACRVFLDEQIEIIDPKMIVTLGRFSLNKFLPGEYISRIHGEGREITFAGKKRIIVPMFHPAAALRRGEILKQVLEDFQKLPKILEKGVEEKKVVLEKREEEERKPVVFQLNVFGLGKKDGK